MLADRVRHAGLSWTDSWDLEEMVKPRVTVEKRERV